MHDYNWHKQNTTACTLSGQPYCLKMFFCFSCHKSILQYILYQYRHVRVEETITSIVIKMTWHAEKKGSPLETSF